MGDKNGWKRRTSACRDRSPARMGSECGVNEVEVRCTRTSWPHGNSVWTAVFLCFAACKRLQTRLELCGCLSEYKDCNSVLIPFRTRSPTSFRILMLETQDPRVKRGRNCCLDESRVSLITPWLLSASRSALVAYNHGVCEEDRIAYKRLCLPLPAQ